MNCLNMVEDIETTVSTKTEGEVPVILHLSDLHFGSDESCQGEIDTPFNNSPKPKFDTINEQFLLRIMRF